MPRHLGEFQTLVEGVEDVDLARAALVFAREEYPELRPELYLARLGELALELAPRITGVRRPHAVVETLSTFLFQEQRFQGNESDYYDPRNSYLNDVIDRRLGIPITLSVITLEVARRLFLPVHGVGFPGHFLVKYRGDDAEILFDPFHRGEVLAREECQARLDATYGGALRLEEAHLEATPAREILARMLQNLKAIYGRGTDHERTERVLDYLLVVRPDDPRELRTRGELRFRLGRYAGAEHDLVRALSRWPAGDATRPAVEALLAQVRRMRGRMN